MSLQTNKTDAELGRRVEDHLKLKGVNTPMEQNPELLAALPQTDEDKINQIKLNFDMIMLTLGLDLNDDSLQDTPNRVGKMFVKELYWGLNPDNFPKCTVVDNKMHYNEMVIEKNISTMTNCEHHFVTIDGKATVAYIPNEKVLGLSKINRIVEYFAKRPQIQERLTQQISEALKFILGTDDVAVCIDAIHYCVKSRGVEDTGSSTITSSLSGAFMTNATTRNEFFIIARS